MVGSLELGNARKESGKGGKGKGRARGRRPKWLLVRAGWDLPRVSPSQLKPNPRSWNPRWGPKELVSEEEGRTFSD